jgi:hypothetical protein
MTSCYREKIAHVKLVVQNYLTLFYIQKNFRHNVQLSLSVDFFHLSSITFLVYGEYFIHFLPFCSVCVSFIIFHSETLNNYANTQKILPLVDHLHLN